LGLRVESDRAVLSSDADAAALRNKIMGERAAPTQFGAR